MKRVSFKRRWEVFWSYDIWEILHWLWVAFIALLMAVGFRLLIDNAILPVVTETVETINTIETVSEPAT